MQQQHNIGYEKKTTRCVADTSQKYSMWTRFAAADDWIGAAVVYVPVGIGLSVKTMQSIRGGYSGRWTRDKHVSGGASTSG